MEKNRILLGKSTIIVGGRDIGYTEGGVSIEPQGEDLRFPEIDQLSGDEPAGQFNCKVIIKFTTPSISFANLMLGWNLSTKPSVDPDTGASSLGLHWASVVGTHEVVIASKWFDGRDCTFTFYKCYSTAKGGLAYSKKDHAKMPITLETAGDANDWHGHITIDKDLQ